jgi:hypothetical protein
MEPESASTTSLTRLAELLRRRLRIIADREFCARDPAAHLLELQKVSAEISALHAAARKTLPARLNHFLDQASFQKALEFVEPAGA